jgi:hypothetical protein
MLLWVLDCWITKKKKVVELSAINSTFIKPLNVGNEVSLINYSSNDKHEKIELSSNGVVLTKIDFVWDYCNKRSSSFIKSNNPRKIKPKIITKEKIESESGEIELYLNIESADKLFPNLVRYFSNLQIATLLASTRLVGTRCPGMFSIYSEINLLFNDYKISDKLKYRVAKYDSRFNLVSMQISGPFVTGVIKSFIRPKEAKQVHFIAIRKNIKKNEFKRQSAIIIGGSRGLGEVTAKLLAAGSADIKLSYNKGEDDAKKIVNDINANGGTADYFQYDVLNKNNNSIKEVLNGWSPTHLYFFATPFIFSGIKGIFSDRIHKKFCKYYVSGFNNIIDILLSHGLKRVFYPSTIAIDEKPPDMEEYVSAKLSGEMLCQNFEKKYDMIKIYKPRLPRMETDQTVSLFSVVNSDPLPIQLEHLRIFRDRYEV